MSEHIPTPHYYEGMSLSDMEASLRADYLTKSGWLESATAKLSVREGKPIPWFTYAAIRFLEQEISSDLSLFEYGGGQSTLYWCERVKQVATVDHDPVFEDHVRRGLPSNESFYLVEENTPLTEQQKFWADKHPSLVDPERTTRTYRSGQLNQSFKSYALKLLEFSPNTFDIVIVDGMARVLSTWAAIQHFRRGGFIVFDNSDRDFYQPAFDLLNQTGYRRIDFWGMGPINPYEWCTSVFFRPEPSNGTKWFSKSQKIENFAAIAATDKLGILVLGYNRPYHLQSVLESIRLQGRIGDAHVWIDGTQGRGEHQGANTKSIEIADRYAVRELRAINSHLGIEKMMLEALEVMSGQYERVLILEDDCFPVEGGINLFEKELSKIEDRPDIYSVYGHHFGTEPANSQDFSRFQGWGWAAHSKQIRAYLPRLKELFLMSEADYKEHVVSRLTEEVYNRLNRTPGRDVINVLKSFFSWDSATALLTALDGVLHRRTIVPAVVNTGITKNIGHFQEDREVFRKPPFNMITLDEVWAKYDNTTQVCDGSNTSYGLDGLDRLIIEAISKVPGFYVELGAYDGVTQSNSVLLEKAGWQGLLIEANPASYAKCLRARPNALVEHAACVAEEHLSQYTTITDVGLMSMTSESKLDGENREVWISRGEGFAGRGRQEIDVPTATLSQLLDKHDIRNVDLLLLDVEGAEVEVLKGLDFSRHAPKYIVAEDAYDENVGIFLGAIGYARTHILLERKYTRDCLYLKA